MLDVARAIIGVLSDVVKLSVLFLRSSSAIRAENLVLRRQLARYIERGVKPRRVDHVTRVSLSVLCSVFDWRDAVVIVRPATVIRWHRLVWLIFWRWKCRAGRPPIPPELRTLIRRMAMENPLWGEERIANELLVKLGIQVSSKTVGKYMSKRLPGQPRGDQRWPTFPKNHAKAILACDFSLRSQRPSDCSTFSLLSNTVAADWCASMSWRIQARSGPCSNCEKLLGSTIPTCT